MTMKIKKFGKLINSWGNLKMLLIYVLFKKIEEKNLNTLQDFMLTSYLKKKSL